MDKKEQTRLRVKRYRDSKKSVTDVTQSVTNHLDNVTQGVTHIPAIVRALIDPVRRKKLEDITLSLKKHGVDKEVRYGIHGPTFDMVGDLLDVTA